jgi:hypothetical protein
MRQIVLRAIPGLSLEGFLGAVYVLAFVGIACTSFGYANSPQHKLFWMLVFSTISLQTGHVVLTYFLIIGDRELRQRFPWKTFGALNLAIGWAIWFASPDFGRAYPFLFLFLYDQLRNLHDTQQGYGVARWVQGPGSAPPSRDALRLYIRRVQALFFLAGLVTYFGGTYRLRVAGAILATVGMALSLGMYAWPFRGSRSPERRSAFVAARFCLSGLGFFSPLTPALLRTWHGLEYQFVFFRISRRGARFWIAAAFLASVLTQFAFLHYSRILLQGAGALALREDFGFKAARSLIFAATLTHMLQDWWIFSFDSVSARRLRELMSDTPQTA